MNHNNLQRKLIPPFFVMMFSLSAANIFGQNAQTNKTPADPCTQSNVSGTGLAADTLAMDYLPLAKVEAESKVYPVGTKPLRIVSKPQPKYTDEARQNCAAGIVKLKITFLADGKVGNIKILKGLGYGLSKRAVEAAKLIKFEPEIRNNKPKTITAKITYNFTIY